MTRLTSALLLISLTLFARAAVAAPKPGLAGSFELAGGKTKTAPEQAIGPMLTKAIPDAVWARIYLTFDGDRVTIGSQALLRKAGVYTACTSAATTKLTWTGKGFSVAANLASRTDFTTFKDLTPEKVTTDTTNCSASLDAGNFVLGKDGDRVTMTNTKGETLFLVATDDVEKPDWRKHLPRK
ncbi:MAG: hypothetical protein IPQ07_43060 [Myxococcales bacterium]|nr:hypothetical protein [Myxococcales bacterium]